MFLENEGLLNEHDVAKLIGVSVSMLQKLRHTGNGPIYHRIGNKVRYSRPAVMEWLAACTYRSTSQYEKPTDRKVTARRPTE